MPTRRIIGRLSKENRMYFDINKDLLSGIGRRFVNSKLTDNISYIVEKNNFTSRFLSIFLSKKRQRYIKSIILKELSKKQHEIKKKLPIVKAILDEGDIIQLKTTIDSKYQHLSYLSYSLDYLIDELNIDIFNGKDIIEVEQIIPILNFVFLKEIIFYVLCDLTYFKKKNNTIYICPNEKYAILLKKRWLALVWDKQSLMHSIIDFCKKYASNKPYEPKRHVDDLGYTLLDKVFYLNKEYIDKSAFGLEAIKYLQNLCKFFALLLYNYWYSKKTKIKDFLEFNIQNDFISKIILDMNKKANLDKGFMENNGLISFIDGAAYWHIMRKYFNDYCKDKDNKVGAINKIGNIFQDYVFNYIKTISSKYKQFEIINFNETFIDENTKKKLDIDLILLDKVRNKYFLIQTKYSFYNSPYLKDEIKHYLNNKKILDGIEQLKNFKYFYEKDDSLKIIFEKEGLNIKLDDTYLILLHTIPIFDISEIDGVILYDWNTFRNLLQNGIHMSIPINLKREEFAAQLNNALPIENIDFVMDFLMSLKIDEDTGETMATASDKFSSSFNEFKLEVYTISTNIK